MMLKHKKRLSLRDNRQLDTLIGTSDTPRRRRRGGCTPKLLAKIIDLRLSEVTWVDINIQLGITSAWDWVRGEGPGRRCKAGLSKAYKAKLTILVRGPRTPSTMPAVTPTPVQDRLDVYVHLVEGAA